MTATGPHPMTRQALHWLMEMGVTDMLTQEPQPWIGEKPMVSAAAPLPGRAMAQMHFNSLSELYDSISAFDGCPLRRTATNTVICDGRPDAPLMVIGEAPGAEEDRRGKPFIGPAGQLLDRMLAAIGRDRHHEQAGQAAYISNIIFWRPPGNRDPNSSEVAACLPFVLEHIRLVAPRLILTLGAPAAHALTGETGSMKSLRGRLRTLDIEGRQIALLPTYHPAYLLRTPAAKALVWEDLLQARALLEDKTLAD
jgi:uracil-DNA glycosylase